MDNQTATFAPHTGVSTNDTPHYLSSSPLANSLGLPSLWKRVTAQYSLLRQLFIERVALKSAIDRLYLVGGGHIFFQTLVTATRLGIFNKIENGDTTIEKLAASTGTSVKAVRIIMLGLASLKLVKRSANGQYRNTIVARTLLDSTKHGNVLPIVEWQAQINYRAMAQLTSAALSGNNDGLAEFPVEGTTLYGKLAQIPELEQVFQDAMQSISQRANDYLVEHGEFFRDQHVMDIGGGNGTNLLAIAKRWGHVRGTVFDSQTVCEIARANIKKQGYADRLGVYPGNCFDDQLPYMPELPIDSILLSHFCTIWSETQNKALFKKCNQRLPEGGRLLVFNMMQENNQEGPLSAAMGSPYFLALATGEGMLYTWEEYETWLRESGFRHVKRVRLPMDHGLLIATK